MVATFVDSGRQEKEVKCVFAGPYSSRRAVPLPAGFGYRRTETYLLSRLPSPQFLKETIKMMMDWNGYRQQLLVVTGKIARLIPETMKGYITLSAAGTRTNYLDAKTRELIALAVAVTLRCDGCITVHTEAAIKHDASREEIAEALGVAVTVNAGAALVYSARVMDAYEANPAVAAVAGK
jgi:AhpD family alkylhydroperoxidase